MKTDYKNLKRFERYENKKEIPMFDYNCFYLSVVALVLVYYMVWLRYANHSLIATLLFDRFF